MRIIHIAGTNGKGSVAEYISNMITAAGMKCGCFTSPHLISPTERIRLDGEPIKQNVLEKLLLEVQENHLTVNDSLFAAYTAAAMLWFSRVKAEYAVMETGLGGRLDPTNVVQSDVVVLTSIDYDHTDLLGQRLEQIATEKCGIIKQAVPVVSAKQHKDVEEVIRAHCLEKQASLSFVDNVQVLSASLKRQKFLFNNNEYKIKTIGQFQPENAALAILAAQALGLPQQSIKKGLDNTILKARTQYIQDKPSLLIDGAHNPSAVKMLVQTLNQYFENRQKVLLYACMKDKDYNTMIDILAQYFDRVIVTNVDAERGADTHMLQKLFKYYSHCIGEDNVDAAFSTAKQVAKAHDAMLVVCGSLYLAGYILSQIKE